MLEKYRLLENMINAKFALDKQEDLMLIAGDNMNLKDYLYLHRMSITEFSDMLEYSRNHISQIVNGRLKPGIRLAKVIEKATNGQVTVEELMKGSGNCREKR